jgi:hypothetical protein
LPGAEATASSASTEREHIANIDININIKIKERDNGFVHMADSSSMALNCCGLVRVRSGRAKAKEKAMFRNIPAPPRLSTANECKMPSVFQEERQQAQDGLEDWQVFAWACRSAQLTR